MLIHARRDLFRIDRTDRIGFIASSTILISLRFWWLQCFGSNVRLCSGAREGDSANLWPVHIVWEVVNLIVLLVPVGLVPD